MSTAIQYRPFFSLEMLHDFYLSEDMELLGRYPEPRREELLANQYRRYQLAQDLSITPTPDCAKTLGNYRLLFKSNNRGFFVGGRVIPIAGSSPQAFTSFVPLDETITLRFVIQVKNPYFYNMTNLRMEKQAMNREHFVYYFSNRAGNTVNHPGEGDRLYLSRTLTGYNANAGYEAGEIIFVGNIMSEAIQDIAPGTAFNADHWKQIYTGHTPHFQFISSADRLPLRPGVFSHTVFNAVENHRVLRIRLLNRDGTLLETFRFEAHDPSDPMPTLRQCTLNLRSYSPGIYSLEVERANGTLIPAFSLTFYLDDLLYQQKPLALIECFHEPGAALGAYRWIDETANNRLRQPIYHLRWKSRSTIWRYYYETAPGFTSTDVAVLAAPNDHTLMSSTPFAMSQMYRRVEINPNGGDVVLLPNPGVEAIFPENGRVFSEINMGGGLGPPAI
jgi:hypothetical protein